MMVALHGKIASMTPLSVALDTGPVTYEVHTPLYVTEKLRSEYQEQSKITLYTRVIYSETAQTIYGFLSEDEARLFDFLRSLHGIGPKIIISLLSHMEAQTILELLEGAGTEGFTKIPGVGKAKAQKMVFEAQQKKKKLGDLKRALLRNNFSEGGLSPQSESGPEDLAQEIIEEALQGLGFQKKEIDRAARSIEKSSERPLEKTAENVQEWVRLYLKHL